MKPMRPAILLSISLIAAGCRSTPSKPSESQSAPTASTATLLAAKSNGPHACAKDDDCVNSCRHGAVNRSWWESSYPGGEPCEDGCAAKGTDPAKCEQGECVAFFMGRRFPACTQKNETVAPGPGPAHRCQEDKDCRMSCRYGAVNAAWYTDGAKGECKDGCAQARRARCDSGACVAVVGDKVDEGCTKRSIYTQR
jgi:hypothetical protein